MKRQIYIRKYQQRGLNDVGSVISQITNPKITTVVEISPDADKLLKTLIFTLSGALVVSAVIRARS
jgi:hypothetical protein